MNGITKNNSLKICVLGNSHVGSLKLGWNVIEKDYPEIKLTFFAERSMGLENLRPENGKLIPTERRTKKSLMYTSGGHSEIDLSEFDLCLIYGLSLAFPYKLEIDRTTHYFSKAAYECSFRDGVTNSLSLRTLKKIRKQSDIPVYIGHNPLMAYNDKSFVDNSINYSEFVVGVNRILEADNAILLAQPNETITENIYSKPEYNSGATQLDVGDKSANKPFKKTDFKHMNDVFGWLYLAHFFQQIPTK